MKKLILNTALLFIVLNISAQYRTSFSALFQLGIPQDDYAKVLDSELTGIGANLALPIANSSVFIGMEYAYSKMGTAENQVSILDDLNQVIAGDLTVKSNVQTYHGMLRLSPFTGRFKLYFDVVAGTRAYTTKSHIEVDDIDGTITYSADILSRDNSFSYGYGAGLMLGLSDYIYIDARVQSLRAAEAFFVDQESITIFDDGSIDFDLISTETNVIVPQVGLTINF